MSLLNRVLTNSKSLNENLEFVNGMNKLFSSGFQGIRDIPQLPIEPTSSQWEEIEDFNKRSLKRSFEFKNQKHIRYFINEILRVSSEYFHDPIINISAKIVEIELYTHDINDISEQDLKIAKFIDEIYDDVKFIQEF